MKVYQKKWEVYRAWCKREGRSASRISLPQAAEFLLFLHEERKVGITCLQGYRCMLSKMFGLRLPELSNSRVLRDLLRSFFLHPAAPPRVYPQWDVNDVLKYLSGPPFEPLNNASFRDLTKKVLFLTALATVQRVGELKAISFEVAWAPRPSRDALLFFLPKFLAKTERQNNPLPRSFRLCSLEDFVGSDEPERLLCPIRALRRYLQVTSALGEARPKNLFVSPSCRTRALSKNALSFFLRETIAGAMGDGATGGLRPRAHSIRGAGTSIAYAANRSLKSVMEAARWRSNTVFVARYLNEVAYRYEDRFALGPFVAAGQVIDPSASSRSHRT